MTRSPDRLHDPFFLLPSPHCGGRVMCRRLTPYLRTMFGSRRAGHARWLFPRQGGPIRTTSSGVFPALWRRGRQSSCVAPSETRGGERAGN
nr:MAG TPA: hypothetical protein [Caudoviricetes sp.]